jgi:hypothetical protein
MYKTSIILSDEQNKIYNKLLNFINSNDEGNELILIGYAGTGKTTLITKFIIDLVSSQIIKKIAIAAPTHKAVGIIKNKLFTGISEVNTSNNLQKYIEVTTIHRLLNYKNYIDGNGTKFFAKSKVEINWNIFNLLVVDECSMLNDQIINDIKEELVKSKNNKLKIIYVGDPAQLPPVNQRTSKIFDKNLKKLYLEKIIRTNNNSIVEISNLHRKWILSGNDEHMPILANYECNNINLYQNDKYIDWLNRFVKNIKKEKEKECINENKVNPNDFNTNIILTWTNKKCDQYNDYIRKKIFKKDVLNKFEKGELLIFGDYYRIKINNLGEETDNNYINFYTSEQVKLYEINENKYTFKQGFINLFTTKHNKFKPSTHNSTENNKIFNQINKIFLEALTKLDDLIKEPINIYEMYVQKINNEDDFKDILNKYKKKIEINMYKNKKINKKDNSNIIDNINEQMKYISLINKNLFEINKIVHQSWINQKNIIIINNNNSDLIKIISINKNNENKYNQIIKDGNEILIYLKELIYKYSSNLNIDNMSKCDFLSDIEKKISSIWKYWNENVIDVFAQLNYGYCITVHKSQGSTFKNVFIDVYDIFDNNNKEDSLKCLYTAITRCSDNLYMLI